MSLLDRTPFVTIEWLDITDSDDWDAEDQDPDCAQMLSAGWLVEETKLFITLARTFDVDNEAFHEKRRYPKKPIVSINRFVPSSSGEG